MHSGVAHTLSSSLEPLAPVALIADLMSSFQPAWFLCGGWAVDSWLGRQTREHGDLDITVFHDDQRALFDHLSGWNLIAHDPNVAGATTEPWDGRRLDLPAHIHARPGGDQNLEALKTWVSTPGSQSRDGLDLEIIINERKGNDWVLAPDPSIALPLDRSIRQSPVGVPTAVPEVLMFYKATAYRGDPRYPRRHDEADFRALVPALGEEQREWLREAISLVASDHPWLAQIE
jgi:Aminoglycoside-2''-adenylyltransferase